MRSLSKLFLVPSTFAKLYNGRAGELEKDLCIELSYRRLGYVIRALETKSEATKLGGGYLSKDELLLFAKSVLVPMPRPPAQELLYYK